MTLFEKYRPKSFPDMQGNFNHINRLLSGNNVPHAWLLTGHTGCGKTTAARIIANTVGGELDIEESDMRKIDEARDIIARCQTRPFGKAHVFIFNEFHRATTDAQEALLTILENPPATVYFILCSSEPKDILEPIKGRCTPIKFPPLPDNQLFAIIDEVCEKESININGGSIKAIIAKSDGSARKALVLLDKVRYAEPEKRIELIEAESDSEDDPTIIELCRAVYLDATRSKWKTIAGMLSAMKTNKMDSEAIRRSLLGFGTALLLKDPNPHTLKVTECFLPNTYDTGINGLVCQCVKANLVEGGLP